MNIHDIIVRPIITEKSLRDAEKGKFTFLVSLKADKEEIKKAVANAFAVHPLHVSTMIVKGKSARTGKRRTETQKQLFKKAIVEIQKGETIDLFAVGA